MSAKAKLSAGDSPRTRPIWPIATSDGFASETNRS